MADWDGGISVVLHHGSSCSLWWAVDGRIMHHGDNVVLRVLSSLKCNAVCAILSKYNIPGVNVTEHDIKDRLWKFGPISWTNIYVVERPCMHSR